MSEKCPPDERLGQLTDEETTDDEPDGEDAGEVLEEEEGGEEASGKEAKSCKP